MTFHAGQLLLCTLDPNNNLFFLRHHNTPYVKSVLIAGARIIHPVITLISSLQLRFRFWAKRPGSQVETVPEPMISHLVASQVVAFVLC